MTASRDRSRAAARAPTAQPVAATQVAAGGPQVVVRELGQLDELVAAGDLFDRIWAQASGRLLPTNLLRALQHAGGYIAGAYDGARLVGASVGFLGLDGGELLLHSHVTGAAEDSRGVGYALKQHQRRWCLERGITRAAWTFDPLVSRNAYFNLHKLGATGHAYLADFYGEMPDAINAGDPTDRLLALWRLDRPQRRSADGATGEALTGGAVLLDADSGGRPQPGAPAWDGPLRCRVPADIVGLRRADPGLARRWRLAVRAALTAAFERGYQAVDASRDGCYLLVPGEDTR